MNSFTIFLFLLIFLTIVYYKQISVLINLFDYPNKNRSLHKYPVSKIGGVIILLIIFNILNYLNMVNQLNNKLFLSSILLFFLFGILLLADDFYDLSPNPRIIIMSIVLFIYLSLNQELVIKDVKFFFFEKLIILQINSTLFTILCILLLVNAINLMDGVNGLLISHFIFWFILLIFKINFFFILILFCLSILLFMNLCNKLFLGNLGSGIIGTFLSIYVLKNQNNEDLLNVEKIFLLFIIPGLDMLRVFSERIFNKKNPFTGDRNHLHHLLLNKYSKYKILFIYCSISFLPVILTYSMKPEKLFYIITISTFAYIFFIIYLKKN
jgi:UDP-GlcNAc:undecaprenyl-phosphate GlcNAc-1-phosphate transferase